MQRRSEAIRNAINRYNIQAVALNPPRPKISWKDIVDYSFLGEFDLLRHSRGDIRTNDWAKPGHREATNKFFKLRRAHEEVERLNIEVRRLRTAIHAEELQTSAVIDNLLLSDPRLAAELQRQWRLRAGVNAVHRYRLDRIESLAGFSGIRGIGVRMAPDIPSTLQVSTSLDVLADSGKLISPCTISVLIYVHCFHLDHIEHLAGGGINAAHMQHPSLAPNASSASHASRSLDVHAGSGKVIFPCMILC